LQHFNATYRSIVGSNNVATLLQRVATCCNMLGVVGSNLKMIKFSMQHLWMLHDVVIVWLRKTFHDNSGYRLFSHNATADILSENNETVAMFMYQTNPVGVEIFSYLIPFLVPINFHGAGHASENAL